MDSEAPSLNSLLLVEHISHLSLSMWLRYVHALQAHCDAGGG